MFLKRVKRVLMGDGVLGSKVFFFLYKCGALSAPGSMLMISTVYTIEVVSGGLCALGHTVVMFPAGATGVLHFQAFIYQVLLQALAPEASHRSWVSAISQYLLAFYCKAVSYGLVGCFWEVECEEGMGNFLLGFVLRWLCIHVILLIVLSGKLEANSMLWWWNGLSFSRETGTNSILVLNVGLRI